MALALRTEDDKSEINQFTRKNGLLLQQSHRWDVSPGGRAVVSWTTPTGNATRLATNGWIGF